MTSRPAVAVLLSLLSSVGFGVAYPGAQQGDAGGNGAQLIRMSDGRVVDSRPLAVDTDAMPDPPPPNPVPEPVPIAPRDKIDPQVARWIQSRPRTERYTFVVLLQDDIRLPRFPRLDLDSPPNSPRNARLRAEAERLAAAIRERRLQDSSALRLRLAQEFGARIFDQFWLVNALWVELPLAAVPRLATLPIVMRIEADQQRHPLPLGMSGDPDTPGVARGLMGSDAYRDLGLPDNPVALIDSGILDTHPAFAAPAHVGLQRDCVNGLSANCTVNPVGVPLDPVDCDNHGTASAGLLSGAGWIAPDFAGVTEFTVDSFKVAETIAALPDGTCTAGSTDSAFLRAAQAAVVNLNRVVVTNVQHPTGLNGVASFVGDALYWTGHVVVAANGNFGPLASTVTAPAIAHNVLGIGAQYVPGAFPIVFYNQGRGPTPDQRIKPDLQTLTDIQAPTITFGALPEDQVQIFGGTSAATPLAGGAAALFDAWIHANALPKFTDPGQVYSLMLLSGPRIFPTFDNDWGVGLINMPSGDGQIVIAKAFLSAGERASVQIAVDPTLTSKIDAAIWWPEFYIPIPWLNTHRNVDLRLINPDGVLAHESVSVPSVFERSGALWSPDETPPPVPAHWTVEVEHLTGPGPFRVVYLAVWERH